MTHSQQIDIIAKYIYTLAKLDVTTIDDGLSAVLQLYGLSGNLR